MPALESSHALARALDTDAELIVHLSDGRTIANPLVWYPTLLRATPEQRSNAVLGAYGIHWPEVDEDLSVAGMLAGVRPSYRWMTRAQPA